MARIEGAARRHLCAAIGEIALAANELMISIGYLVRALEPHAYGGRSDFFAEFARRTAANGMSLEELVNGLKKAAQARSLENEKIKSLLSQLEFETTNPASSWKARNLAIHGEWTLLNDDQVKLWKEANILPDESEYYFQVLNLANIDTVAKKGRTGGARFPIGTTTGGPVLYDRAKRLAKLADLADEIREDLISSEGPARCSIQPPILLPGEPL